MTLQIKPTAVLPMGLGRSDVLFTCRLSGKDAAAPLSAIKVSAICGGLRKRPAPALVVADQVVGDEREETRDEDRAGEKDVRADASDSSEDGRLLTVRVALVDGVVACTLFVRVGGLIGTRGHCSVDAATYQRLARFDAQKDPGYDAWFRARRSDDDELVRQRAEFAGQDGPLFSVIMPVFRTPAKLLRAAVDSVLAQSYDRLELVLVNVSGVCPEVDAVLAAEDDPRIRVIAAPNRDIAINTNVGIEAARGDYLAFLDHDDILEPDALYWFARELRDHPQADLLFSADDLYEEGADADDGARAAGKKDAADGEGAADKTDAAPAGRYFGARFKPGWNPDLFLTHNYVFHLMVVSSWAARQVALPGSEHNGAQDYDLAWKVAEVARDIRYIPRVAYHWRSHAGSTSGSQDSKPYAIEAGRLAIQQHLERAGVAAEVGPGRVPFSYKVVYPVPLKSVSVVVTGEGRARTAAEGRDRTTAELGDRAAELRGRTAAELRATAGPACREVITAEDALAGARRATGDRIVLVDVAAAPCGEGWLEELAGPLARPDVACVAPMLIDRYDRVLADGLLVQGDGSVVAAEAGLDPAGTGYLAYLAHARDVAAVPGLVMAFRRDDYLALGGADKAYGALAAVDLCLRARARGLVVVEPYAPFRVENTQEAAQTEDAPAAGAAPAGAVPAAARSALTELVATAAERAALLTAHPELAAGDPYLDPNLDSSCGLFPLAR